MPTLFISEQTQFENLGDLVLNIVLAEALAKNGRLITIRSRATPPPLLDSFFEGIAQKRILPSTMFFLLFLGAIKGGIQVVCLNPGGLKGSLAPGHICKLLAYTFARICGIRLMRVGISLGPITPSRRVYEELLVRLVDVCAVRDRQSLLELRGRASKRVEIIPDLALISPLVNVRKRQQNRRDLMLISLRLHGSSAPELRLAQTISTKVRDLSAKNGFRLAFVAQVKTDQESCSLLAEELNAQVYHLDTGRVDVLEAMSDIYSGAAMLVTNRLHAGIFAAMNGCLPVAFIDPERDQKIGAILSDINAQELAIFDRDVDASTAKIQTLLDNRTLWVERLDRLTRLASMRGERKLNRLVARACASATCVDEGP